MLDAFCFGGRHAAVSAYHHSMKHDILKKSIVGHLCIIVGFSLFGLSVAGEVVECAIFHECSKGEDEADRHEKVHSSHIGNFGQGLPGDGA